MVTEVTYCKTPIGIAKIVGTKNGIASLTLLDVESVPAQDLNKTIPICLQECVLQLNEYFNKERASFNLTVNPKGTAFQIKVWQQLLNIPYGKTTSYLQQSKTFGNQKAIRAIAAANGKNPLAIIIPCHRVIGTNGSLTGYAGGLWRKKWLLNHENPTKQTSLF